MVMGVARGGDGGGPQHHSSSDQAQPIGNETDSPSR